MKNHLFYFLFFLLAAAFGCQSSGDEKQTAAPAADPTKLEQHRPRFHFSPPAKWMNDPNGLVFHDGEYHLFYQHYPDSNVWGPMHWGHAVSRDLAHWEHLPIALFPDSLGYIFSGSAVVDSLNTSGFGQNGKPPLVAMFTYHDMPGEKGDRKNFQYQAIAYSNDNGRTWTKYSGNPVIPNPGAVIDFRDPKVFWHAPEKKWVMVLAESTHIGIYTSPDLKKWTKTSEFGKREGWHGDEKSDWECPDLFQLKVVGKNENKWVLLVSVNPGSFNGGSGTQYFVGKFDGKTFVNDNSPQTVLWLDHGWDNYAGVTWGNAPVRSNEERIFIGWMSNWLYGQQVPTTAWRSAMTLPRTLKLRTTGAGLRLVSVPVEQLEALRKVTFTLDSTELSGDLDLSQRLGFQPATMEVVLDLEFPEGEKTDFGIALSNSKGEEYRIGFDAAQNQFYSDRSKSGKLDFSDKFAGKHAAPRLEKGNTMRFHVFFDVASAELFADWGATTMTEIFFPNEDFNRVKLYAAGGKVKVKKAEFYQMANIWE